MTQLVALPDGTELKGDYTIRRVLGAGGFGITYLAEETALSRFVSIKEYFPSDFASRDNALVATPRSKDCRSDYTWGLDRFLEEGQTLAKFNHEHIVKVYRIFRANGTAYMVLHFEEGKSLKAWLKGLKRAPRQKELDAIVEPLLDALETIHKTDFLHRDIAPDNVIIRKAGDPVLIDFGAARGELAAHSKTKTVSALVKPGYSPYEQYAESSRQQGPWTDIYALAATLYHCVTGKRPPDSPSRVLKDEMVPVRDAALAGYRAGFLDAITRGLALSIDARPQSIAEWRGALLAPDPEKPGVIERMKERTVGRRRADAEPNIIVVNANATIPPPPDAPGRKGGLLDFVDALKATGGKGAVQASVKAKAKAKDDEKALDFGAFAVKAARGLPARLPPPVGAKAGAAKSAAVKTTGKRRSRPNPDVARSRSMLWSLGTRAAIAATIASLMLAFPEQIARVLAPPGGAVQGLTTGTITSGLPNRALTQSSEFKAHEGTIDHVCLSGDGSLIVTVGRDGTLKSWSSDKRELQGTISLRNSAATSLTIRNHRAAVTHTDGTISVYDLAGLKLIYSFKRNDATVWAATFAGSEDRIAAAGHDWNVAVWESASQTEPAALLQGHDSAVQAVAADTAGRWLATGGADRSVKLWNLDRMKLRRSMRNQSDFVSALAFSPDGGTLASGSLDGSVRLWAVSSGRLQRKIAAHQGRVTALTFSPAGDLLASASEDGSVRVRGLKHTRLYWTLGGTDSGAKSLAFANDGQTLVTGGLDGLVRVWSLPERQIAQRN